MKKQSSGKKSASKKVKSGESKSVTERTVSFLARLFRYKSKRSKPKDTDLELICKLFKLSEKEVRTLQSVFNDFDLNKDGFINEEELAAVLKNLGQPADQEEVKRMIKAVDDDSSGNVDFQEFLKMMTHHIDEITYEEELKQVFRAFDHNNNGFISIEELSQAMKTMGEQLTDEDINEMMSMADSDKDGKISFEGKTILISF